MMNDDVAFKSMVAFPDILPLPNGFQPEGIVIGPKHNFYVGSVQTGIIYKGDLRTGQGLEFITPTTPSQALGLAYDKRSSYLFVSGGYDFEPPFTGTINIYDSKTGDLVQTFLIDSPYPLFINDVIVTNNAAYFTDSINPVLYKIALEEDGRISTPGQVEKLLLEGFSMTPIGLPGFPFPIFANGIEASPSGKILIIGNLERGELYKVDPATGEAILIDLGGDFLHYSDGILLDGKTLYVVQNLMNQIAVVKLNDDYISGLVVDYISNSQFHIPSTIAEFGSNLYAVNAHFDEAPPGAGSFPDVEFEIIKVMK